jgi:hypothetical protein
LCVQKCDKIRLAVKNQQHQIRNSASVVLQPWKVVCLAAVPKKKKKKKKNKIVKKVAISSTFSDDVAGGNKTEQ